MLENVVFLELIRRGYRANQTLFYYRTTKGNEVDFLLRKGHVIEELVQVAFSLVDPGTRAREIRALLDASRELGCKRLRIITFQDSEEDTVVEQGCRIRVEGVLDWANV